MMLNDQLDGKDHDEFDENQGTTLSVAIHRISAEDCRPNDRRRPTLVSEHS